MFLGLALIAGAVEAGVGYPDALYRAIGHPVTWIGRLIAWADERWNSEGDSGPQHKLLGAMLMLALVIGGVAIGFVITRICFAVFGPWLALIPLAILASSLLAQRSLYDHVDAVAAGLDQSLDRGRQGRVTRSQNISSQGSARQLFTDP